MENLLDGHTKQLCVVSDTLTLSFTRIVIDDVYGMFEK